METKYFISALYATKYGRALKYYDDKGFHWMMPFDKPVLFDSIELAADTSKRLKVDDTDLISDIQIKEISVYEKIWENKIQDNQSLKDAIYQLKSGNSTIVLTKDKSTETAKMIEGIYRVDRTNDVWIYSENKQVKGGVRSMNSKELIQEAFEKLEEAKAVMHLEDEKKEEIAKVESIMVFLSRILK